MVDNPTIGTEGLYTCYASNMAGSSTRGTNLIVTGIQVLSSLLIYKKNLEW